MSGSDKLVVNETKQVVSSSAGVELLSAMRPEHPLVGVVVRAAQVGALMDLINHACVGVLHIDLDMHGMETYMCLHARSCTIHMEMEASACC
jgi:hypothetical protein